MRIPSGLHIDDPAYPLLQELVSYWGITSGAGAADGSTLVSSNLADEPSYLGHLVKMLSGDAAGCVRRIVNDTTNATGTVVVDSPFTDSAGNAEQITASTLFVIISDFENDALYYGTATSAGAGDGSTIIDTVLSTPFTVDDEPIGHSIRILTSSDASLVGQEREIYDYDVGTTTLVVSPRFTSQVPISTTYVVLRNRPSGGGGPIPPPEPAAEETLWRLADYDNFDVVDATADTERWSSEYQVGAADGSADINTTTAGALRVNITAAAVLAAAQYGVRRLWRNVVRKFFTLTDITVTVTSPNANHVWAGLAVSRGIAWDTSNYIVIYKRQNNVPVEGIAVEYNLAGAGAVITTILATTDDAIAFKIERENTIWRCYYSLTQAPRHHWILALEIEDPTNTLTDTTSTYLTVSNPEDAVGQQVAADFLSWEYYETLGNLGDIINLLNISSGALAFIGYCPAGMAASTTVVDCPNLGAFPNDTFNTGYQMIVLRNANALATAPEMEMRDIQDFVTGTGRFTVEAFSATVEASDIVLIIHNSVAKNISVFGIADAGSDASTIRDAVRTEGNDYWNGQQVMMLSGNARGQVRPIYDFVAATDDILVTPTFGAAIAAGDIYCILTQYQELVPGADAILNLLPSDVVGNKTDVPDYTRGATQSSIVALIKGILGSRVVAEGTLTLSSATVPEDNTNAAIADSYNGLLLMPLTGADAFLPRRILDWTAGTGIAGTGIFTIDPNNPFPAATGAVLYIVIADQTDFVPAADGANNRTPSDVVGTKTSTAIYAKDAVSDIIRYIKGLMDATITAWGTADAGSGVAAVVDAARTEANDWWNGQTILMLTGAAAFQKRPIADFVALTDTIVPSPDFDAAVAAGDIYVILAHYNMIVPRAADNTTNLLTSDVVGRQDDTIPAMNAAPGNDTIVRQVKAILERVGATPADPDDSVLTNLGQRDDAATADTLADITTTSIQAKIRRILTRMSPDAFTATIQGNVDTALDAMLGDLATYFVAAGAAMALQVNGNLARTNLQQALTDFFAAFGCDGVNVFNPTIQGAVRTDLDAALYNMATYFSALGAAWSVQINGNAARTNLEQVWEDFSAVFGADGVNVFNPTIQGASQTNLDAALAQLAIYFAAAGAAMSVQVNGGVARANLELILEDYFAVVGCDGANVFNPTIQGVARLTFEAAFDGLAAYFVAAGGALSVTIDPGGVARTTLATLWNDLGQMLAGAAGITIWPVRAKAANTISMAEAIRDIDELKPEWAARTSATHTTAGVTEETILTTAYTTPGLFYFNLTLRNMVAGDDFTIRVYKRVDGTNYDLKSAQNFVDAPLITVYEIEALYTDGTEFIRVTIQRNSGTNRAFPYSYNAIRQPVV